MFKPMLAPTDKVDLTTIKYPLLASTKLDGYRCIINKGKIVTRSLKQVQNKQLNEKLELLRKYSEEHNLIIDGEIFSPDITFQELNRYFMCKDFEDKKSIKKYGKLLTIPEHVKFYAFDVVQDDNFDEPFINRLKRLKELPEQFKEIMSVLPQVSIGSVDAVEFFFKIALDNNMEGLILKDPNGRYKTGRGTLKENLIFKVKPFETFDGIIQEVEQATKVDPNAEKTINELGRSVTSKKQGDRILINKAANFVVNYKDTEVSVVIAMTDLEKEEVWKNKESYIGKTIEYKGLLVGAKDKPRHPGFLRFIDPSTK